MTFSNTAEAALLPDWPNRINLEGTSQMGMGRNLAPEDHTGGLQFYAIKQGQKDLPFCPSMILRVFSSASSGFSVSSLLKQVPFPTSTSTANLAP